MGLKAWFSSLFADKPVVSVMQAETLPTAAEACTDIPTVKVSPTAKPRKRNKPRK